MLVPRFDVDDLRRLLFELTWHPYGGGGLVITRSEVMSLDIDEAQDLITRVYDRREAEAKAIAKANRRPGR